MKVRPAVRRRYRRFLVVWLVVGLLAALVVWQLDRQHQASVENVLAKSLAVHRLSWHAVQVQHRDSIATYYEEYVERPEILALLADAQRVQTRDESRSRLLARLAPVYQTLAARGIGLFQFHLPDGESLLRLHQPARFGDDLAGVRTSIRRANETLEAVHGFEAGRQAAGYRSVFPIIDDAGVHLGSVEFSIPFPVLLEGLEVLDPGRRFQIVLDRTVQEEILFDDQMALYQPWPGSDQFVILGTQLVLPETADMVAMIERLNQRALTNPEPDVWRLGDDFADFVLAKERLAAPDGAMVGLLLSASREPALIQLDNAFRANAVLAVLGMLILGLGAHALVRVTSAKLAERERLNLLTRSLGQGMYALDEHGVITEVNPRACSLLGYEPEQMVGRNAHALFHPHSETDSEGQLECPIVATTSRGERFSGEKHFCRRNGEIVEVSVTSVPLTEREGSVTLFDDITRQKDNERKLHHIAHYDALTALPNRVLLADRLAQAMARARRANVPLALAFVDLDGFKAVNDTYGHETGDRLLMRLAQRMQKCVRETDTVARLGGDEFAVLLTDMSNLADYARLLDRLLAVLAEPETIEGHFVQVSASIGVSLYPQSHEIDADQLLRQADHAMYDAKLAGKNQYRVFDVDHDSELRGHHDHVEQIRLGLENDEFLLYFQPRVNLRSGKVTGAEALIRWQHPERGLLMPEAFLPSVSRHSLEVDLGRWVLRRALSHMLAWQRSGLRLPVSVNISADHIQHADFVPELESLLRQYEDIAPSDLQLEIAESTALDDVDKVSEAMRRCADLGVEVVLDDFGTGSLSLTHLKGLPHRALKMDRNLVSDLLCRPNDLAILDGVVKLASAFGLHCTAKGVSSARHGQVLLQMGCESGQGYAIARPMPPAGLMGWIAQWKSPEAWSEAVPLNAAGLELLYAEVEQREWLDCLVDHLKGLTATPPVPQTESRLSKLIKGRGLMRLERKIAEELSSLQEKVHDLAAEMIQARARHDVHAALVKLPELESLRDAMVDHLQRLARKSGIY